MTASFPRGRTAHHADEGSGAGEATVGDAAVVLALRTPPLRRVVPDGVFDAFGWCASDTLLLRRPRAGPWERRLPLTADNPPGMAFVLRAPCDFLPKELARLHVRGVGLVGEWALAPYGIDDATDALYARRARPRDWLWLAAEHNAALAWGLHDWAHFHNHGPFVERAWTELQCDAAALSWLWINRAPLGMTEADWETSRRELASVAAARFEEEGKASQKARAVAELDAAALVRLAEDALGQAALGDRSGDAGGAARGTAEAGR